jgi:hypothetical protein
LLPLYRRPASTVGRPQKAPRLSFLALQHFRNRGPLFSLPLLRKRLEGFALPPKGSALRVWLPSRRPLAPRLLGDLFQSPTLVGFPLRSFALLGWSVAGLPAPFRPCAFFQNLAALDRRSGDLIPPRSRVPWSRGFTSGRAFCSLGLWGLSGSPSAQARQKPSSFLPSPPVLCSSQPHD